MAGLQYYHSHRLHVVTGRFFQQVAPGTKLRYRPTLQAEIEYKQPPSQYKLYQECGFVCLSSACTLPATIYAYAACLRYLPTLCVYAILLLCYYAYHDAMCALRDYATCLLLLCYLLVQSA
eukprot:1794891-Rhodomonas_salina.3